MLWKFYIQYVSKLGKLSSGHCWAGWTRSVFIPIPKKGNANECSHYWTIALISHTSKVKLKILQATFQQYVNWELSDVQAGLKNGSGIRDQIANICWLTENKDNSRKTSTSASLTKLKPLAVWITTNCGKFLKRWEYQMDHPTCFLRNLYEGQEAS